MKITELESKKILVIQETARKQISDILREFGSRSNKIQLNDVIKDHYHTIKVKQIITQVSVSQKAVGLVYKGEQLRKDGEPTKRQDDTVMYEENIGFCNNKPYIKL